MLAAKIDLLLKKFHECATDVNIGSVKAMDSQMTCEVVVMLATEGMTTPRPMKRHNTSTTSIANKEEATIMVGTTNLIHHSNVIRSSIQISIRINLH
jgi:hypothetical protein